MPSAGKTVIACCFFLACVSCAILWSKASTHIRKHTRTQLEWTSLDAAQHAPHGNPVMPLRTKGPHIIDALGRVMRLKCVNWNGGEGFGAPHGLESHSLDWFATKIAELGFNCVRLPFAVETFLGNATRVPDAKTLAANPALQDKTPLEILDASVAALTREGILIMLNVHTLPFKTCCGDYDGDGLWYTTSGSDRRHFTELEFYETLVQATRRYKSNPLVVAFDLKNEIRPDRRAVPALVPTWGSGDVATDWYLAALQGSLRVLAEDQDMLIVVSGLNFGMCLCDVPRHPLHLVPALKGHIVYESHNYVWFTLVFRGYIAAAEGLSFYMGCHCAFTVSVAVAWFCSRLYCKTGGAPSSFKGVNICMWTVAMLFTALTCVLHVCWWIVASSCGMMYVIWSLILYGVCFLFRYWTLTLWMRACLLKLIELTRQNSITIGDDLHGPDRKSFLSRIWELEWVLNSWPCMALVFQAVALALYHIVLSTFFTYDSYAAEMDRQWGFLGSGVSSDPASVAPVIVGEFGLGDPNGKYEVPWFGWLLRYLRERSFAGIAYWTLTRSTMEILKPDGKGGLRVGEFEKLLKPLQEYMQDTSWGK